MSSSQSLPIIEAEYVESPAALTVPIVSEMDAKNALDTLGWKIGQRAGEGRCIFGLTKPV